MRWVVAAVGVLVVVGLGFSAWAMLAGGDGLPDAAHSSTTPAASASNASAGASPGATPVAGSEVTEPGPTATSDARLPALPQSTPFVAPPLPADAAADGRVVDGFPVALLGPAPESEVTSSSVTSDGATLQAALTARTDQSPAEVAAHYGAVWTAAGLTGDAGDRPSGELAYADQYTAVSLSAREAGTGTVYTLYGTLRSE